MRFLDADKELGYPRGLGYKSWRRALHTPIITGILALSLVLLISVTTSQINFVTVAPPAVKSHPADFIHLLIPASHADANLCKVMLSASILGYPSPRLINWNQTFDDSNLVEGGSHIAKITGIKSYLSSLGSERNSDLAIMVDAYDIWFQLRPQTLLDRFLDINRRADERVINELGADVVSKHGVQQNILFSAQKRCWPWSENDPPCYAVPQSSLPEDIYGPATDTDIGDERNPYIKFRQRFLNSGVAVGTVGAMRKLFTEALLRAEKDPNFGSDQQIFSQIYGDQEIYRELLRQDSVSWFDRLRSWWNDKAGADRRHTFNPSHVDSIRDQGRDLEFNLGVDSESSIGLATVFAEDDTDWLTMNNESQLHVADAAHGITPGNSRLGLQPDIKRSLPPYWTFSEESVPRNTSWSEVPLFTNVPTGIAPVIIHHNAHRDGLKSLRESWWDRIWFQEHARTLFDASIYAPIGPVAVSRNNEAKRWWSADEWKGGARDTNGTWIRYEDICIGSEAEVFRDDKGIWTLPDNH